MIPVAEIVPENLYSQDDAEFLLGDGFTPKAARQVIGEACRSGNLISHKWGRRHFFAGREFLVWLRQNGLPVGVGPALAPLAPPEAGRHHSPANLEAARRPSGGR
jgi:hypothetical protein